MSFLFCERTALSGPRERHYYLEATSFVAELAALAVSVISARSAYWVFDCYAA